MMCPKPLGYVKDPHQAASKHNCHQLALPSGEHDAWGILDSQPAASWCKGLLPLSHLYLLAVRVVSRLSTCVHATA